MRAVTIFSLLALLSVSFATRSTAPGRYDQKCEWVGTAPFCGHPDCPSGYKEYARSSDGERSAFPFGSFCWFGSTKALCCKPHFPKREAGPVSPPLLRADRGKE